MRQLLRYFADWTRFLCRVARHGRNVRLVDTEDGTETVERWPWEDIWHGLRPCYDGMLRRQPCGCTTRLGRVAYISSACKEHWST